MTPTTACTACGAPMAPIVDPRIRARRLICERRDCLRVESVLAQWEVESVGGQLGVRSTATTWLVFRKDGPIHKRRQPSPERRVRGTG